MKDIDFEKPTEIIVKSQYELDLIPLDFKGRIYIEFGTYFNKAIIKHKYNHSVVARGNASVEARGNASVEARGNASVEAWGNASVDARGNASVAAWENASVEARGNASVEARGNVQIVDFLEKANIKISGNARIVFNPKTIHEFMDFYGIKHNKKCAVFYKSVRKKNNCYFSDYDNNFYYDLDEAKKEVVDDNENNDCGSGIHISHLAWALDFGRSWNDVAILEVETKIDDIVLPKISNGKVRTSEVKVLREVPLSECGVMGKILERRLLRKSEVN